MQLEPSDAAAAKVLPVSAGQGKEHGENGGTATLMGCWALCKTMSYAWQTPRHEFDQTSS